LCACRIVAHDGLEEPNAPFVGVPSRCTYGNETPPSKGFGGATTSRTEAYSSPFFSPTPVIN
jgi:hypothetical protein